MNSKKMSKIYFFQTIEKRLKDLEKEVEEMKKDPELTFEARIAKENIIFGRALELNTINSAAMDIDYWKYAELDKRTRDLLNKI